MRVRNEAASGFALNSRPVDHGRGSMTMSWAGIRNTYFWIDREKKVSAVLLSQMLPFGDPGALAVLAEFDSAVYEGLESETSRPR